MFSLSRRLGAALFVVALIVLGVVGWTAFRGLGDLTAATAAVQHTRLVRAEADGILSLLKDAETAQRGFIIVGADGYLEPYEKARKALPDHIERLRHLTADNNTEQTNVLALDGLVQRKLNELRDTIKARRESGFEAAADRVKSGEGRRIMDAARAVVSAIGAEEDRLLSDRERVQEERARSAAMATIWGIAVALAVLTLALALTAYGRRSP